MKLMTLLAACLMTFTTAFGEAIDLKASSLQWKGTKVTGEHTGKLSFKSGEVKMKDGKLTGGNFVVDVNSLTVEDLKGEWATKFIGHMKSKDFFEVEKHPTASMKIKKVADGKITADLTIKGKTNEVTFPFKKEGKIYSGKLEFDRTKFDMVYGSGDFFKNLGDKMIHNEVKLDYKFVVK